MKPLEEFSHFLEREKEAESETFDIRFEEVVSLMEQERFSEAASLIEPILEEEALDIRLVMYLFYAHFLEKGLFCLEAIFENIFLLFEEHEEKISPTKMKEKHCQNSLIWFFSSVGKKLRRSERLYKEKRADDFWGNAIARLSTKTLEKLKEETTHLIDFFNKKWKGHPLNQHIQLIYKWLGDLSLIDEEEKKASPPQLKEETKSKKELSLKPSTLQSKKKGETLEETLLSSKSLHLFYQKIQTFESLIYKEDFTKAALIADDIRSQIDHFNPTEFFPKLFTNYFSLMAKHITTLSEEWEKKGSLTWNYLEQLYQGDLDAFIHW